MYGDVKFILSGSSYETVPDHLPILVRQVYLSQFQPVCEQLNLVYVDGPEYWDQIPRCSWPEGTATKCPQVLNLVAHQHSASNVGGDTNQRRFCKKQSTFRISESFCCVNNGVVRFKFTKIKIISVVLFLKLQPNPISAQLALTHGCMANGGWIGSPKYPHSNLCNREVFLVTGLCQR